MQFYQTLKKHKLENLHRDNGGQTPPLDELPFTRVCVGLIPLETNVKQVKAYVINNLQKYLFQNDQTFFQRLNLSII